MFVGVGFVVKSAFKCVVSIEGKITHCGHLETQDDLKAVHAFEYCYRIILHNISIGHMLGVSWKMGCAYHFFITHCS